MNCTINLFISGLLILSRIKDAYQKQKQSNDTDHDRNRWGLDGDIINNNNFNAYRKSARSR